MSLYGVGDLPKIEEPTYPDQLNTVPNPMSVSIGPYLSIDHDVLTKDGFKRPFQLKMDDLIATFGGTYMKPKRIHVMNDSDAPAYFISNNSIDIYGTPELEVMVTVNGDDVAMKLADMADSKWSLATPRGVGPAARPLPKVFRFKNPDSAEEVMMDGLSRGMHLTLIVEKEFTNVFYNVFAEPEGPLYVPHGKHTDTIYKEHVKGGLFNIEFDVPTAFCTMRHGRTSFVCGVEPKQWADGLFKVSTDEERAENTPKFDIPPCTCGRAECEDMTGKVFKNNGACTVKW